MPSFFSSSSSSEKKVAIGSRKNYLSNRVISLVAQQDSPIDRSFMHIIIFTQHDAVQCVALAHLIFLKQQLFLTKKKTTKAEKEKLSNEIGCIIEY